MIKAIVSDFSRTLIFPRDENYNGSLNKLIVDREDEINNENLVDYFFLNDELLNFLNQTKQENSELRLLVFTTGMFANDQVLRPQIDAVFERVIEPEDLGGLEKTNPESFKAIAEMVGCNPQEIVFIDDQQNFIDAAIDAEVNAIRHSDNQNTINQLTDLLT